MTLSSMTGFARSSGTASSYAWAWEVKTVNAKGLELRLRIAPGWDAVEPQARARANERLARGTVHANLTVSREGMTPVVRVNEPVLEAVLATIQAVARRVDARPPSLDGLLALKGVIEVSDPQEDTEGRQAAEAAIVAGFDQALVQLAEMRRHEGDALGRVLGARLDEIASLTKRAEAVPGRQPEAIRAQLAEQIAALLETSDRFDPDRLHQEAIVMATKADVREELDRLAAHITQARRLMQGGGAVGRRLDFLSQEFNREANTLCAKANDIELTNIGLELKSVVEQFREQVQNLE